MRLNSDFVQATPGPCGAELPGEQLSFVRGRSMPKSSKTPLRKDVTEVAMEWLWK